MEEANQKQQNNPGRIRGAAHRAKAAAMTRAGMSLITRAEAPENPVKNWRRAGAVAIAAGSVVLMADGARIILSQDWHTEEPAAIEAEPFPANQPIPKEDKVAESGTIGDIARTNIRGAAETTAGAVGLLAAAELAGVPVIATVGQFIRRRQEADNGVHVGRGLPPAGPPPNR